MTPLVRGAAWRTATFLVGGLALAVGLGAAVDGAMPFHGLVQHVLPAVITLGGVSAVGAGWGRAMGRLAGANRLRQLSWAGALGFGLAVLVVGIVLSVLESLLVERGGAGTTPTFIVYRVLFVPATVLVAGAGGAALGIGLGERALARRLGTAAALAAGVAFLAVNVAMDLLGWRVGAPEAAKRATMVTVTLLGSLAAALAAGGAIGAVLARRRGGV